MASTVYYSPRSSSPSKPKSFSSEYSCRGEDSVGINRESLPRAWPMSQPIQFQNSTNGPNPRSGTLSGVPRRNASLTGIPRVPRPMSMPSSHHLHVHVNALATLNSYCLDAEDISPVEAHYLSPDPVIPTRLRGASEMIPTPTSTCAPWIPNVKAIKKLQSKIGMGTFSPGLKKFLFLIFLVAVVVVVQCGQQWNSFLGFTLDSKVNLRFPVRKMKMSSGVTHFFLMHFIHWKLSWCSLA